MSLVRKRPWRGWRWLAAVRRGLWLATRVLMAACAAIGPAPPPPPPPPPPPVEERDDAGEERPHE